MRHAAAWVVAVALGLAGTAGARAGSIWAKAEGLNGARAVQLYQDDTARNVGDILTIIIDEQSTVENQTDRKGEKDSKRSIATSGTVQTNDIGGWWGRRGTAVTLPTINATSDASSDFEGKHDYQSDRRIADQITVTVQDVLPNGCLIVLGTRQRTTDGDTQTIQVSGIVRPSDITFANTVQSGRVADFRMALAIKGHETGWTTPGWLGRILNWLSLW